MTIDDNIREEKYKMKLTEKHKKYQHYHLEKLIKVNILQVKKHDHLIKKE